MFGLSKRKESITVHMKVAGFIDRKMVTAEFDLAVPAGTTVKRLLGLADKSGQVPGKVLGKMMGLPRPPTVLVNGLGLDVPDELGRELAAGDEVTVMTPMAGG